jgi:hypothetical protein
VGHRTRVLSRRWVVERTFAWLGQSRRLSKDYERLSAVSEAMIYGAMSRLMLRRLTALGRVTAFRTELYWASRGSSGRRSPREPPRTGCAAVCARRTSAAACRAAQSSA